MAHSRFAWQFKQGHPAPDVALDVWVYKKYSVNNTPLVNSDAQSRVWATRRIFEGRGHSPVTWGECTLRQHSVIDFDGAGFNSSANRIFSVPAKLTATILPCDLKHRNAAGRLLAILERFKKQPNGNPVAAWATAFNCNGDISDIYARLGLLREQYTETLEYCELEKGKDHRLTTTLPKVLAAIQPNALNDNSEHQKNLITDEILLLLDTVAEQMPQEGKINDDDFKELNRMLDELFTFVNDSDDFKGQLRLWLLNLVRMMKDGLCRYDINGARGLRSDLLVLAHELTVIFNAVERGEAPDVPTETVGTLRRLSSAFVKRLTVILDAAVKYAPLIRLGVDSFNALNHDGGTAIHSASPPNLLDKK